MSLQVVIVLFLLIAISWSSGNELVRSNRLRGTNMRSKQNVRINNVVKVAEYATVTPQEPLPATSALQYCNHMAKRHKVQPGINWGTLTSTQQTKWMEINCDQYFCQQHPLAGKGTYKCVPLTRNKNVIDTPETEDKDASEMD